MALVAARPGLTRLESLARIHAAMEASEGPHFDGFYIKQDQLGRTPSLGKRVTFSLHGVFHESMRKCGAVIPSGVKADSFRVFSRAHV